MRILAIGGVQFIGHAIVERLAAAGHDVTVLHRRAGHDLGPRVRDARADRSDLQAVARIMEEGQFEAVFDVAYDWEKGTPADQVEGAARACGGGLRHYVFMSTIAAYGPGLDHRESDPLVPDEYPNPYAQQKASSERALFRMHEATGFPVTTFRPPFVHGPRQPFYREQFFWDRLLDGRPIILPDTGDAPMQTVSVADLADACVRVLEVPTAAGQAFNVAHAPTTQRGFVEGLARAAGVAPLFVEVPRARIEAAGGRLMMGNLYFGEYLDLPPHTEAVEHAPRVLGVTPRSFDEAIGETFAWYQTQPRRPRDYAFEDSLVSRGL